MCHLLGNNDCCDGVAIYAYRLFLFFDFSAFDIVFLKSQVITNTRNSKNIFFFFLTGARHNRAVENLWPLLTFRYGQCCDDRRTARVS